MENTHSSPEYDIASQVNEHPPEQCEYLIRQWPQMTFYLSAVFE